MKTPGQAAYEAYYAGTTGAAWRKIPAVRRRLWDSIAQAALDAHNANIARPQKSAIVTHGGLEHGDVVVFTGQESDNLPWVVCKTTWTNGLATLKLSRRNGSATVYKEAVVFGDVRKIDPSHLGPPRIEVIVPPADEPSSCSTKGCGS